MTDYQKAANGFAARFILTFHTDWTQSIRDHESSVCIRLYGSPGDCEECPERGVGRIVRYQYLGKECFLFWTVNERGRPVPNGPPPSHQRFDLQAALTGDKTAVQRLLAFRGK